MYGERFRCTLAPNHNPGLKEVEMNNKRLTRIIALALGVWLAAGCTSKTAEPTTAPAAGLPNPASVYCEEQGHRLDIRTDQDGGQYGVCILKDGTECEEWAYFRGECGPAVQTATVVAAATPVAATATPTPATSTPAPLSEPSGACAPITVESGPEYKLWHAYTHDKYGFSLLLPPGWVAEEITEPPNHTLRGHAIILWSAEEPTARFQVAFRHQDEEQFIGRTGMGSGDIVEAGTVCFIGQEMSRHALVFEGKEMTVMYGPGQGIERGDMVFTLYLDYRGGWEDKTALSKEIQAEADQIVATFQLTNQ